MARILLLEDDDNFREVLSDIMTQQGGYLVDEAADGRSAVELAKQHVYDLMVADIRMAGPDGLTTVSHIKQAIARQRQLPIVMITGYENAGDSARAVDIAVDAYLHKNKLSIQDTLRVIQSVLGQKEDKQSFLGMFFEPISKFWQGLQDRLEERDRLRIEEAKAKLSEAKDTAYRRLVTAIMSNNILQSPSLDIFDALTEIDIKSTRCQDASAVAILIQDYAAIREKIAKQEHRPELSLAPRAPGTISRPQWKKIYERVKTGHLNAVQMQFLERLRQSTPEERREKPSWKAFYEALFA